MSNPIYEQPAEGGSAESLSTIGSGEEAAWYMERHGRQFHRQELQHKMLKLVVGQNFVGPLPVILSNTPQRPVKRVLDVGSGTGRWVQEMAEMFPHVHFVGVDLVPAAPEEPPDNAQFELYDIEKDGVRNLTASMDVVHCRFAATFMQSRTALVTEIARVLRPGGMVMLGEMEYNITTASGRNLAAEAPDFFQWFETIRAAIRTRLGLSMDTPQRLPQLLHEKGFRSITTKAYNIPIGAWTGDPVGNRIGEMNRQVWLEFVNSTRPMLVDVRRSEQQVDRLVAGVRTLLEDLPQGVRLLSRYHTIWALRGQSRLANEQAL
ncbi:S-adenosyl-L-methionine-dependent methyltransferase [Calocera cornea HHB12733]|uniref:S-adenosyl-L-methionine-dependent methyltransferase n=1 Tax=Calocera cornea HHB12733 TaxID=1353952 RepID=A0A165G438_9BASI|nr:S-adenosyl-L-methionine-dependent methyltransferase [Calocera cornea HHB12733]